MQFKFEIYESRLDGIDVDNKNISKIQSKIEQKLVDSDSKITEMYNSFELQFNDIHSQFNEEKIQTEIKIQKIQEITDQSFTLSSENNALIEVMKKVMETVQASCDSNIAAVKNFRESKLDVIQYEKNNIEIGNRLRFLDFQSKTLNNVITCNDE